MTRSASTALLRARADVPAAPAMPRYRFWGDKKPEARAGTNGPQARMPAPAINGTVAIIRLWQPIDDWGGWWGMSAEEMADILDGLPSTVTEIHLHLHSPGGHIAEAIAMANLLRQHRAKTVAVVDGYACSAASYLAVVCDETVMGPETELMIHDASLGVYGNAADHREIADLLDHWCDNWGGAYAAKAGGTTAQWREVMRAETWFSAEEAVAAGLADRVGGDDDVADAVPDQPTPNVDDLDPFDLGMFAFAGRAQAPAPTLPSASAAGPHQETEGAPMPLSFTDEQCQALRDQLGVTDENADAATLLAALGEALTEQAEDTTSTGRPQTPEGMTLIETDVLESLRTGAEDGRQALAHQRTTARDTALAAAVRDGKITPARRDHYASLYDADPEGTVELLDGLPKGIAVPTAEVGAADTDQADADIRETPLYKNWSN